MKHRFICIASVLVALSGLGAMACGSGSSDGSANSGSLTLEQYFHQVGEADSLASARFSQIGTQLGQQQPEAQALETLKDVYPEEVATLEDLVQRMDALKPPADVKDAHDAAVEALKNSVLVAQKNSEGIQSATSAQQATDLLGSQETTQANERTSSTCLALEKAGTDRGITVDLDC